MLLRILTLANLLNFSVGLDFYELFGSHLQNLRKENVSEDCFNQLQIYGAGILHRDVWALQIIDATSKIPSAILSGNTADLGDFDQCIRAISDDGSIQGKYCLGHVTLNLPQQTQMVKKIKFERLLQRFPLPSSATGNSGSCRWAACLPSACTGKEFAATILPVVGRIIGPDSALEMDELFCQTNEDVNPPLTIGAVITIFFLSAVFCIMLISTVYDIIKYYKQEKPHHELLVAFSILNNGGKLFKTSSSNDQLSCLNGVKSLSMMWILVIHTYSTYVYGPVLNLYDYLKWMETVRSMYIMNGLPVETFFLIGGMLVAYSYMASRAKCVLFNIPMYYVHRYIRITPPFAVGALVSCTLFGYLGSGPFWSLTDLTLQQPCIENWWSNLLYIQNFVGVSRQCLLTTWYLTIDMQLFFVSPLILIPMWKWPKLTLVTVCGLIMYTVSWTMSIALEYELVGLPTNFFGNLHNYISKYYNSTICRSTPWLIGLLLGYATFITGTKKAELKLGKVTAALLWAASLAILITCIFIGHTTLRDEEYNKWGNAFYIAFNGPMWAVGMSWVILACVSGYGGPLNSFLSLPVFEIIHRLSFSIYLLHYPMMRMLAYSRRHPVRFNTAALMHQYWGNLLFSAGLAVIWVLAFEYPAITIEKCLLGGAHPKKPIPEKKHN